MMKNIKMSSVESIEMMNDQKLSNIIGGRGISQNEMVESTWGDSEGTECVKDDGKAREAYCL